MTEKEPQIELDEVELSEQELEDKKMMLASAEISRDDSTFNLEEYIEQLDLKIPQRLLDDTIEQLEGDIKTNTYRINDRTGTNEHTKPATETEMDIMKIKLRSLKKMKKADLPMRDLRFKINQLRRQKSAIDAPEQQIDKLKREIKTKKAFIPKRKQPAQMPGVG
jgi:hypothetical protein